MNQQKILMTGIMTGIALAVVFLTVVGIISYYGKCRGVCGTHQKGYRECQKKCNDKGECPYQTTGGGGE
jgi:hypothetical protein